MANQCSWNNSFGLSRLFTAQNLRQEIGEKEQNQCQCAYIGKRSLSWAPWIPWVSQNRILAPFNKELSHEHIFLGNNSDNIGFGESGLFNETSKSGYRMNPTCFDSEAMRQAVLEQDEPSYYGFIISNCQTYVERVLDTYRKILKR